MGMTAPLMKDAASEARKAITALTSLGTPIRPRAVFERM